MKEWAKGFYKSQAWKRCAAAYRKQAGGLCERCLKEGRYTAGAIVHHKIYITPDNIYDPSITLNFENLELVCMNCHGKEHGKTKKRYRVDNMGRVVIL